MNGKAAILKCLPNKARLGVIALHLARKRRLSHSFDVPSALTFFVTKRCNLKCAHCFYWESLNPDDDQELSLQEIENFLPSLKRAVSLALTGGEPFLRKDLPDICGLFSAYKKAREIGIATNGYDTDGIVSQVEKTLSKINVPLSVQISIDGLEEAHDEIRGAGGSFKKAVATMRALNQIRDRFPDKLKTAVAFTIQKKNYAEVGRFIDFILPFRIPARFLITRGRSFGLRNLPEEISSNIDPRVEESADIAPDTLEEVFRLIARKNISSPYKFWGLKQKRIIEASLEILKTGTGKLPCYAGALEGVIYSDGDVAFCEFTKAIGNLKERDYNFYNIWNSDRANRVRELIKKCFCIHSCALGTSLLLNDPEIVNEALLNER